MAKNRPIRIGLHAPRNAGKTCLFACLYGLRPLLLDEVTFDNDETLVYLKSIWKFLKDGSVPPATAMTRPTEIGWRLRSGGDAWELLTCDYPGALIEPGATAGAVRELKDEARAWFRSCDALLILVDSSAPDVEQVDVVDILVRELIKESGDGRTMARPMALVLTKWDTHGPINRSREDEQERLQQYLVNTPIFERIGRMLREAGGRFAVFAISAFGRPCPAPGVAPPIDQMKPYQLLAPWKWAATQYMNLARTHRRRRRQRRIRGLALMFVMFLVVAGAGYFYASRQALRQFDDLSAFRQANAGDSAAALRLARDSHFLETWSSWTRPGARVTATEWVRADALVAEKIQRDEERAERTRRHAESYQQTINRVSQLSRTSGREPEIYHAYQQFLEEFPESEYASEFRKAQGEARNKWDERIWKVLVEVEGKHGDPGELKRIVEEYLNIPGATRRTDARVFLGKAESELDVAEYADLRKMAVAGTEAATLEAVDASMKRYLESGRTIKKMLRDVQAWHSWFEGLHREGQYVIRVKSVSIPPKGDLESFWNMQPRVAISLGKTTFRTAVHYGYSPTMQEDLGPFPFKWGEPTRMVVRVENDYWYRSNPGIETALTDDKFILGRAQGKVTIKDDKGKVAVVELECPGAVPPSLPEYQ